MDASSLAPLRGIRVIEFASIGPGPHAVKMLAELGCEVIRVERLVKQENALPDALTKIGSRSSTSIAIDLKSNAGLQVARTLVDTADILIEGFRPGAMERLGVGPEHFKTSNPGLIYVRLTGWGQEGPYAGMAGHDINFIGLTGALAAIGGSDLPLPPLNLLGDFAGGSLFALIGILAGLLERNSTGRGRVLDIAMIDGVSSLLAPIRDFVDIGVWSEERASNLLDGGAPFYRTYPTKDGHFMAVGALEPVFYSAFIAGLGIEEEELPNRFDSSNWFALEELFAGRFVSETREYWQSVFDGTDACVTPVLTMSEAPQHLHNEARSTPATEQSLHPGFDGRARQAPDAKSGWARVVEILAESGVSEVEIEEMSAEAVIAPGSGSQEQRESANREAGSDTSPDREG